MDDGDDPKSVTKSDDEMQQQPPPKRRETKYDSLKVIDTKVIGWQKKYVHKPAIIMCKCYIFRIASLQIDTTVIERVRVRCTLRCSLCCIIVSQTGTNFMVNKKPYGHLIHRISDVNLHWLHT